MRCDCEDKEEHMKKHPHKFYHKDMCIVNKENQILNEEDYE